MNIKKTDQDCSIPESLLVRLFDTSGTSSDGTRGFILFYINDQGLPAVVNRSSNGCVDMALHKVIELYLSQPNPPIK